MYPVVAGEEDAHVVAGVQSFRPFFRLDEVYFRVGRFEQCGQFCGHGAVKLAAVFLPEGFRVGEPGQDVSQYPDGEFEQYFFAAQVQVVGKDQLIFFVYFDAKINKILFAAGDQHAAGRGVVDGEAGFTVDEFYPVFALGHGDAHAVVEVEPDACAAAFLLHFAGVEHHIGSGRCRSRLFDAGGRGLALPFAHYGRKLCFAC